MKKLTTFGLFSLFVFLMACSGTKPAGSTAAAGQPTADGWISLFNGKNFDGWKINENPESFKVEDGQIVVNGPRGHLFYVGPVQNANFKNFEFKAQVMTT